jgi:hypothetical protein
LKLLRSYYDIFEVTEVIFEVTKKLLKTVANKGLFYFNVTSILGVVTSKLLQNHFKTANC